MQQPIANVPAKPVKTNEKHKYVFPNLLSKMMKNVPMNVQLESSMMATTLILAGMILMAVYMIFFTEQTLAFKILLGLNMVGGFIFMSSSLVTTYQQYVSYMEVMDFQKEMNSQGLATTNGMPNLPIDDSKMNTKRYNRKNQALFFGGLILILLAFFIPNYLTETFSSMGKFEYYILGAMILLGVILIYLAVKKPKQAVQKPVIKQVLKTPMAINPDKLSMRNPASPPIAQTQVKDNSSLKPTILPAKPILATQQPVQRQEIPARSEKVAAKPIQAPQIPRPVQTPSNPPIVQPRPIQKPITPIQRPVQQPPLRFQPKPQIQQTRPIAQANINRPNPFAAMRSRFGQRPTNPVNVKKVDPKQEKALKSVEATLNEKLYEINRLKAQQR